MSDRSEKTTTYDICPINSSSDNLSVSSAAMFALTTSNSELSHHGGFSNTYT